jgi:hypothetical protein
MPSTTGYKRGAIVALRGQMLSVNSGQTELGSRIKKPRRILMTLDARKNISESKKELDKFLDATAV